MISREEDGPDWGAWGMGDDEHPTLDAADIDAEVMRLEVEYERATTARNAIGNRLASARIVAKQTAWRRQMKGMR